jgi:heme-degrading monooxygenase HmoA
VNGQAREVTVRGTDEVVVADFGSFTLSEAGYQRIALESLNDAGKPIADVQTLVLSGSATDEAHFNLKERRNAASVHLMYPVPKEANVTAFYCEVTAAEDPTATFYMACGWHRGYFGMQVNSPTERRIIFSVWDSGNEAVDRGKVSAENRVQLVDKGEGVFSGDFGNEGTGGHSHLKYGWKTGETQKFLVTAQPVDATCNPPRALRNIGRIVVRRQSAGPPERRAGAPNAVPSAKSTAGVGQALLRGKVADAGRWRVARRAERAHRLSAASTAV